MDRPLLARWAGAAHAPAALPDDDAATRPSAPADDGSPYRPRVVGV